MYNHFFWILRATRASCISVQKYCIPVGCVGLYDSIELSLKYNNKYKKHAEILVISSASCVLNTYNLNITFYVTLEPCFLCCLFVRMNVVFFSVFSIVKKKKFTTLIFLHSYVNSKLRRLLMLYFF